MEKTPDFLDFPGYVKFDWKDETREKPKMAAAHVILYSRVNRNVFPDFESQLKANVMARVFKEIRIDVFEANVDSLDDDAERWSGWISRRIRR